jgi:hypothetical protein
MGQGAAGQ